MNSRLISTSGVDETGDRWGLSYRFVETDAGRSRSRRPRQRNDCAVRALALALGFPYDEVYDALAEAGRKCGQGFHITRYIEHHVTVLDPMTFPAVKGQPRMNVARFCQDFSNGVYVVKIAKHVFAVINGAVHDVGTPRPDACVYRAWRLK